MMTIMKKKIPSFLVTALLAASCLVPVIMLFAWTSPAAADTAPAAPTAAPATPTAPANYSLSNPLGEGVGVQEVIGRVITIFTGIAGSLALLVFIWGGFTMIISRGNSQMVENGRQKIIQATIGLVIIFGSYAILTQLFRIIGATA